MRVGFAYETLVGFAYETLVGFAYEMLVGFAYETLVGFVFSALFNKFEAFSLLLISRVREAFRTLAYEAFGAFALNGSEPFLFSALEMSGFDTFKTHSH